MNNKENNYEVMIGFAPEFEYRRQNDGTLDFAELHNPRLFKSRIDHLKYAFHEELLTDHQPARIAEKIADAINEEDIYDDSINDENERLIFQHDFLLYLVKRLSAHRKEIKKILEYK
mgnify:CR=1 FL=1